MSRTPLMALLRRAIRTASTVDNERRNFLRTSALAGVATAIPSVITSCIRPEDLAPSAKPKIAVIGAGIAGLVAARNLVKAGLDVAVYEALTRTGGRMFTANDLLVKGAATELGGEFIDSNHADLHALIKEFDLELIDLKSQPFASRTETFFFEGRIYTEADIVRELKPILAQVQQDIDHLPTSFHGLKEGPAHALDQISIDAYFAQLGLTGWIRSLLEIAFITENGLELGEQSALNFLTTIGTDISDGHIHLFGESDERFKVRGGNQQITNRLSAELGSRMHMSHALERIARIGSRYLLTFRKDNASIDITADIVVLAIPFTVLRTIQVDVPLAPYHRRMIDELHYGQNAKIVTGFDRPFWHDRSANGVIFTDLPIQLAWDNTALQGVEGAGLTFYSGGSMCRVLGRMSTKDAAAMMRDHLSTVWPESQQHAYGRIERMHWPGAKYTRSSYSSFGAGQWSEFYGVAERSAVNGTLHFAGEHCNDDFRGYMNGAAVSGRTVSEKIVAAMARATF